MCNNRPIKSIQAGENEMASEFKNTKDFSADQINILRDNVYQVADAYQALKSLQADVTNPDLDRLINDLRDVADGSVGHFTKTL